MHQRDPDTDAKPLSPIAVSLVLWLGAMVAALGIQHVAEHATVLARTAPLDGGPRLNPLQPYAAWGS